MSQITETPLSARKKPLQARSRVTVDAIFEATIQLLLQYGRELLTTTMVAERAGVSVGTLYQYFPNKDALLYGLLQRHLDRMTSTVEEACAGMHGLSLQPMAAMLARCFAGAKLAHISEARALYGVVAISEQKNSMMTAATERLVRACSTMLETCSDARFVDPDIVSYTLFTAMAGATCALIEPRHHHLDVPSVYVQVETLAQSYLQAARIS